MIILDTTFLIDLMHNNPAAVKFISESVEPLATSEIVVHELYFGAYKNRQSDVAKIDALLKCIPVVPFAKFCGKISAELRSNLVKSGQEIGETDCLIAASIIGNGYSKIITRNQRHFDRVAGIEVISY